MRVRVPRRQAPWRGVVLRSRAHGRRQGSAPFSPGPPSRAPTDAWRGAWRGSASARGGSPRHRVQRRLRGGWSGWRSTHAVAASLSTHRVSLAWRPDPCAAPSCRARPVHRRVGHTGSLALESSSRLRAVRFGAPGTAGGRRVSVSSRTNVNASISVSSRREPLTSLRLCSRLTAVVQTLRCASRCASWLAVSGVSPLVIRCSPVA